MRTFQTQNYTVNAPNATHYAFNPALIQVNATGNNAVSATVTVTGYDEDNEARTFEETRDLFNGRATFDIRRFLQILFDRIERFAMPYKWQGFMTTDLVKTVAVTIIINNDNNTVTPVAPFKIDAVFGALMRGESTGGILRRTWFVNFPFTVDLTTKYGDSIDITVDGDPSRGVQFFDHDEFDRDNQATPYNHALIDVAEYIDPHNVNKSVHIAIPHGIVVENDIETIGLTAYHLTIDRTCADSGKHVYLRWIDNQGRFCYYLFKISGTSDAVTGSSWQHDNGDIPTAYVRNAAIETQVRQTFAAQKAVTIGAKLVDDETFDFLLMCAKSPVVDVFDGYDNESGEPLWHRVNVVPATYAKTMKQRQDFTMTINEPSQILQSL